MPSIFLPITFSSARFLLTNYNLNVSSRIRFFKVSENVSGQLNETSLKNLAVLSEYI